MRCLGYALAFFWKYILIKNGIIFKLIINFWKSIFLDLTCLLVGFKFLHLLVGLLFFNFKL